MSASVRRGLLRLDGFTERSQAPAGRSFTPYLNPTNLTLVTGDAAIIASPTSGLVTTEAGGTAQFTVVLATSPSADVTIQPTRGRCQPSARHRGLDGDVRHTVE